MKSKFFELFSKITSLIKLDNQHIKIKFTNSKLRITFAFLLVFFNLFLAIFRNFVAFSYSLWTVLPMIATVEIIVLLLLLYDITFSEKLNKTFTVVSLFVLPFVSMQTVEILQKSFYFRSFKAYLVNYLIFLALYLFVSLISRIRYAVYTIMPLSLVLGLVNHYVLQFRGTAMQPWDIAAAKTAINVLGNFIFTVNEYVLLSLFLTICCILFVSKLYKCNIVRKKHIISWCIGFVLLIVSVIIPYNLIKDNQGKFDRNLWDQTLSSKLNGYITNFLLNIQAMKVEPPQNYSTDTVNQILNKYTSDADNGNKPNIIVIMNEAFADLSYVQDFGLEEDYIPFVHSLGSAENAVTGYLNVSVFGGGTCNTEYEFLTSNTSSMLRVGSYPMQQFVSSESVSLASNLKDLGYKTVGVHPYFSSGWNRARSYPLLGFDEFITIDDFKNVTTIRDGYVTDEDCYAKIKDISSSADQPLFVFAVTMQNHGGYETAWNEMTDDVKFKNESSYPQLNQYLELAHKSDQAIRDLIEYYSTDDRDTIVLFFGDHQPSLGAEYTSVFTSTNASNLEKVAQKYVVPFFIWANFDIEEENIKHISPNYLAPLLLSKANMPMTAYQKYMFDMMKSLPVVTGITCIGSNDDYFVIEDAKKPYEKLIHNYDILQYNNVFDQNNLVKDKFVYSK